MRIFLFPKIMMRLKNLITIFLRHQIRAWPPWFSICWRKDCCSFNCTIFPQNSLNLSTEEEDVSLVQDIQDYFEEQPNLRPLEIIKIANNLSKSIVVSIKDSETLQKAQKIEDERLAQLEQAFNQEFIDKTIPEDIFPSSLEVSGNTTR